VRQRPLIDISSDARAQWDGVRELATASKSWLGTMFNPNAAYLGELDALSLVLQITDVDRNVLFDESGGIQIAERISGGRLTPVPEPELISDPARDSRAVDLVVKALRPSFIGGKK
jgi:hypothetical protein